MKQRLRHPVSLLHTEIFLQLYDLCFDNKTEQEAEKVNVRNFTERDGRGSGEKQ